MLSSLYLLFVLFLLFRIITIIISARNEKRLKASGAVEYGKRNSVVLIIAHFGFYISCTGEGLSSPMLSDCIGIIGLGIFVFAVFILYYVIYQLCHIWTVKLLIAPAGFHTINKSFLFRLVKHPNYFLNIIPELIGIALIFHAWYTLIIGLPLYLIPLFIRINQEENIMKHQFQEYG